MASPAAVMEAPRIVDKVCSIGDDVPWRPAGWQHASVPGGVRAFRASCVSDVPLTCSKPPCRGRSHIALDEQSHTSHWPPGLVHAALVWPPPPPTGGLGAPPAKPLIAPHQPPSAFQIPTLRLPRKANKASIHPGPPFPAPSSPPGHVKPQHLQTSSLVTRRVLCRVASHQVFAAAHHLPLTPPFSLHASPLTPSYHHVYRRDRSYVSTRLPHVFTNRVLMHLFRTTANGGESAPVTSPANKGKGKMVQDAVMDDDDDDDEEEEEEEDEDEEMAEVSMNHPVSGAKDASDTHQTLLLRAFTDLRVTKTRPTRAGRGLRGNRHDCDHCDWWSPDARRPTRRLLFCRGSCQGRPQARGCR